MQQGLSSHRAWPPTVSAPALCLVREGHQTSLAVGAHMVFYSQQGPAQPSHGRGVVSLDGGSSVAYSLLPVVEGVVGLHR